MLQIKKLNINDISPAVAALNFEQLLSKLTESSEAKMDRREAKIAELEYKRFLTLKEWYPAVELVPNKLVDKLWHEHILDTHAYARDCNSVFGRFIHHYPYFGINGDDDKKNLDSAFKNTIQLYERHFGPYPEGIANGSRCAEHACHVPTSCACRTPEACK